MKTEVLTFRIGAETGKRLANLARATNRPKTFYANEALELHLEDMEDYYLAAEVKQNLDDGVESVEDWDALCREIDLAALAPRK